MRARRHVLRRLREAGSNASGEVLRFNSCPTRSFLEGRVRNKDFNSYATVQGIQKSASEFVAALKECGKTRSLENGRKLHSDAVKAGLHTDKRVASALIGMYGKCKSISLAKEVFHSAVHRDVVMWTSLILGYVENGESFVAMELFMNMDCEPNGFTFAAALKACAGLAITKGSDKQSCLEKGMAIHRSVKESGLGSDVVIQTALVDMYSKCGSMERAYGVFKKMTRRNVITWTCLILGYVEHGDNAKALDLFTRMDCPPDNVIYVAALKACSGLATDEESNKQSCLEKGIDIHKQVQEHRFESNITVATALVDMYSKCGSMQLAREVFERIVQKNVVTWNCLILGYVENGESSIALDLFLNMDCEPTHVTYIAALKACGCLSDLPVGQQIHARISKLGLEHSQDQLVASTLLDFYGKCGSVTRAEEFFNSMYAPNIVCWNALLAGYSSVGDSPQVFHWTTQLQEAGIGMNGVTFLCILTACSHAGLVDKGKMHLESMPEYGISPTVEHYNCMVDMLGRANRLEEALSLANDMPFGADIVTWRTLLSACRKWTNVRVGKAAFNKLVGFNQGDALAYVMMREIYEKLGLWQDLEQIDATR